MVFVDSPGDGVNRISHVGLVEAVNHDGTVQTIEGNTSSGRAGSQRARDGGIDLDPHQVTKTAACWRASRSGTPPERAGEMTVIVLVIEIRGPRSD